MDRRRRNPAGILYLLVLAGACGGDGGGPDDESGVTEVGVPAAGTRLTAETHLRADVVGYGLTWKDPQYLELTMPEFLAEQRVGQILIEADEALRQAQIAGDCIPDATNACPTDVLSRLDRLQALTGEILAAGGSVMVSLNCATPRWISKHPDYDHSVLSGEDEPSAEPVWACAPPTGSPAQFRALVSGLAGAILDVAQETVDPLEPGRIVFNYGGEPSNYFVGTATELLATYRAFARGVRDADSEGLIRIGGPNEVFHRSNELKKAVVTLQPSSGRVTFAAEELDRPLVEELIRFVAAESLPLDLVTLHQFELSPVPPKTAHWVAVRRDVSGWLEAAGLAPGSVEVVINDFPGWKAFEANDKPYLAAHVASSRIAMLVHSLDKSETVRMLNGFAVPVGSYSSVTPVAGFDGIYALFNNFAIKKPIYSMHRLFSRMRGQIAPVEVDDTFIAAVAAVDATGTDVLLSNFIPAEIDYDLLYHQPRIHILANDFCDATGLDPSDDPFFDDYTGEGGLERLLDDLFSGAIDVDAIDTLTDDEACWLSTAQRIGTEARERRGKAHRIELRFEVNPASAYHWEIRIIDATHANPWADRDALQQELVSASNPETAIAAINERYAVDEPAASGEAGPGKSTLEIPTTMEPNAVHLVSLRQVD